MLSHSVVSDFAIPCTVAHPPSLSTRIMEEVFMSLSRGPSWSRDKIWVSCISCIAGRLFTTESPGKLNLSHCYYGLTLRASFNVLSWIHQAPLPMEFSRQEYWSGVPFPTQGDGPDLGIEHMSPVSPALAGRFFITSATWEAPYQYKLGIIYL